MPHSPFVRRCKEANSLPFLDEQPMVGRPDCSWHRFRRPRLRKWPNDAEITFGDVLGYGVDGAVWKVFVEGRPFALKVFWDNQVPDGTCYYAIQRECHNVALLQMIQSAVETSHEPIHLHPEPKTRQDALANLQAFSDEGRRKKGFGDTPGAVRYSSTPRLRQCFGWTKINEGRLFALPWSRRPPSHRVRNQLRSLKQDQDHYALVYEFVAERAGTAAATAADIQPQIDFLWLVGFCFAPVMHTEEWHKFGLFMDMSDLVSLLCAGWSDRMYRRFVVGDDRIVHVDDMDSSDCGGECDDSRANSAGLSSHRTASSCGGE